MSNNFKIIIPARLNSSRLPKKALLKLANKPMIEWTHIAAMRANANQVIIATDSEEIYECAIEFGATVCMTSVEHTSGTSRIYEVCKKFNFTPDTIIVNVQDDEPLIPVELIHKVVNTLENSTAKIATLACPITAITDINNPNIVKLVTNIKQEALYFSRAPIPWDRENFPRSVTQNTSLWYKHIGIYAYRVSFLQDFCNWDPSPLESIESLEQLRALWHGEKIQVGIIKTAPPQDINVYEDVAIAESVLKNYP